MTTNLTFDEFREKFLAENPAIADPLVCLGYTGTVLETELTKLIQAAYANSKLPNHAATK